MQVDTATNQFQYRIRLAYTPGGYVQDSSQGVLCACFSINVRACSTNLHPLTYVCRVCDDAIGLVTWLTNLQYPFFQQPGPRTDLPQQADTYGNQPGYANFSFLAIQKAVD